MAELDSFIGSSSVGEGWTAVGETVDAVHPDEGETAQGGIQVDINEDGSEVFEASRSPKEYVDSAGLGGIGVDLIFENAHGGIHVDNKSVVAGMAVRVGVGKIVGSCIIIGVAELVVSGRAVGNIEVGKLDDEEKWGSGERKRGLNWGNSVGSLRGKSVGKVKGSTIGIEKEPCGFKFKRFQFCIGEW